MGKHEETLTKETREAKDSGVKMRTMINKLKGMERETPLYDGEGVVIEETKTAEEMLSIGIKYIDREKRK